VVFIHEGHEENWKDKKNCLKKRTPGPPRQGGLPSPSEGALSGHPGIDPGCHAFEIIFAEPYTPNMSNPSLPGFFLRLAVRADDAAIRELVRREHLNPLGRNWRNFLLAEDSAGRLVAIGAVKPHGDGSRELASIATVPEARGRGAAGAVIRGILAREDTAAAGRPLYLTCRYSMKGFYERFGFREIGTGEMTPYFRRVYRLFAFVVKLIGSKDRSAVMMRRAGVFLPDK
jgi:N-acetylglutamate synthase-like GNAT family acetyltransferase